MMAKYGISAKTNRKHISRGITASLILLIIYFAILSIANTFEHAIEQFLGFWYWISLIIIGFGFQIGLYSYIRAAMHAKHMAGVTTEVAATGGVSTGAMIACCAHHLTDVLPIIGLTAAAAFLSKYQLSFIILGVLSNLVGVNIMLKIIQEHKLYSRKGVLNSIMKVNMKKLLKYNIMISSIIFLIILLNRLSGG